MVLVEGCDVVGGRFAREHQAGGHAGVEGHLDVGVEAVADHDAGGGIHVETLESLLQHDVRGFAQVRHRLHARAGLDGCGDRGAVRFPAAARERAEPVRVGLDENGAPVEPDRVEGDLELGVVEGAVVGGDDDVDAFGVVAQPESGLGKGPFQRFLTHHEQRGIRMVFLEPAGGGDHRVRDVRDVGG